MAIVPQGAPTVVNSKTSGTTIAASMPSGNVVNDIYIVALASDDASGTYSCADSQGNSYQTDLSAVINAGTVRIIVFSAISTTVTAPIITVTHPTLTARALAVQWWRGTDTSAGRVDGTPVSGTGTGNSTAGPLTVASDSLMVGLAGYESAIGNTYTGDANFQALDGSNRGGTSGGGDASNITIIFTPRSTAGGTDTFDTTNSASRGWAASLCAYKVFPTFVPRSRSVRQAVNRAAVY